MVPAWPSGTTTSTVVLLPATTDTANWMIPAGVAQPSGWFGSGSSTVPTSVNFTPVGAFRVTNSLASFGKLATDACDASGMPSKSASPSCGPRPSITSATVSPSASGSGPAALQLENIDVCPVASVTVAV